MCVPLDRMPWIESHSVIGRHRKFKGLARQLKISLPQAIGHMHLLWHTAIEQAEDGDLSTWTLGAISESASWEGSEQEFLKAVQDNELMDGQKIHDWLDYAGVYLTSKYKTSNPKKLRVIWAKFGKLYGKELKRNSSLLPEGSPPYLTLPTKPTLPTTENVWKRFREPVERIFGKPRGHVQEEERAKLFPDLEAIGATPEELEKRANHYRLCWPTSHFSLKAIIRNWDGIPNLKASKQDEKVEIDRSQFRE